MQIHLQVRETLPARVKVSVVCLFAEKKKKKKKVTSAVELLLHNRRNAVGLQLIFTYHNFLDIHATKWMFA